MVASSGLKDLRFALFATRHPIAQARGHMDPVAKGVDINSAMQLHPADESHISWKGFHG